MIQAIMLVLFVIVIYFLPSFIANSNGKKDASAIVVLNLFLGWTMLGWLIALIWAMCKDKKE